MSNLVKFAEEEMRRAGLYSKDADYGGMIPEAVMKLVKAHSEAGHSGGSHWLTMQIFNKVINFKPLTPLSDDPTEWMEVSENIWQSRRQSDAFSTDGGKTFYTLEDREKIITSQPCKHSDQSK